jgi:hypothetical protein
MRCGLKALQMLYYRNFSLKDIFKKIQHIMTCVPFTKHSYRL